MVHRVFLTCKCEQPALSKALAGITSNGSDELTKEGVGRGALLWVDAVVVQGLDVAASTEGLLTNPTQHHQLQQRADGSRAMSGVANFPSQA